MKLYIDADACPVVKIAADIAKKYAVDVCIVLDNTHSTQKYSEYECIVCDKGADSADLVIANLLKKGDVVLTQDYGVAAMALAKSCYAINQNGLIFTQENIDSLLFSRHIGKKLRQAGHRTKGPAKRTKADDDNFKRAFEALLEKIGI